MSDMPKCRLCGAEADVWGMAEVVRCSSTSCSLYWAKGMTSDEWRRLHGGLAERHLRALREMLTISGLTAPEVEALRAAVGENV